MRSINDIIEINEASETKGKDLFVVLGIGGRGTWPAQNCRIFKVNVPTALFNAFKKNKQTFFAGTIGQGGKALTSREKQMVDKLINQMCKHLGSEYEEFSKTILGWCEAKVEGAKSDWASGPTPIEVDWNLGPR